MKKEAMLYGEKEGTAVQCILCSHRCVITDGQFGICGVRKNNDGVLHTLVYGEAIAAHIDPIEKKPLYHFLPGSASYSVATIGCNFKCGFCQNWQISQASKKQDAGVQAELMPEQIVSQAKRDRCASIAYTYTEPTIFFEYAYDTAKSAQQDGLKNIFVTNGFMTREAVDTIKPYLDAANVDLKSFRDDFYKNNCGARLQPVLDSIAYMKQSGIWVEVTTLLIPGENDSDEELHDIAAFIADIDKGIPWHISRFHPDYEFLDHPATSIPTLRKAQDIARQHGLRYVYLGNVLEGNDTYCYQCGELLVKREYFSINQHSIIENVCSSCGAIIDGVWCKTAHTKE